MARLFQYVCDGCGFTETLEEGKPHPNWYPPVWVKMGVVDDKGDAKALFEGAFNLCDACKKRLAMYIRVSEWPKQPRDVPKLPAVGEWPFPEPQGIPLSKPEPNPDQPWEDPEAPTTKMGRPI